MKYVGNHKVYFEIWNCNLWISDGIFEYIAFCISGWILAILQLSNFFTVFINVLKVCNKS